LPSCTPSTPATEPPAAVIAVALPSWDGATSSAAFAAATDQNSVRDAARHPRDEKHLERGHSKTCRGCDADERDVGERLARYPPREDSEWRRGKDDRSGEDCDQLPYVGHGTIKRRRDVRQ
jgi:hypothetical protein